ncbi:glycosyltransferase [Carboxylicivirga linearis]|uniref:Glycosyltransferase n=1 Tax=Carboxylicivirga linearis TaxID=1628157 RepID=A0ABS5K0Z1_9BACT|nr:glycosyltransferase [Carboxylicivirga linearis]MBS2100780.1 glycosyltransferase [Carboxylicivirga linearis]
MKKKIIIILSTSTYDAEIQTNKQHITRCLDKLNRYRIIYIDQGFSLKYIKKKILEKDYLYFLWPFKKSGNNICVISPYFLLLLGNSLIKRISWYILSKAISLRFNKKQVIIWIYQPQGYYFLKYSNFLYGKTLYDCVDEFITQPTYKNHPKRRRELRVIEPKLTKLVDYVTTTSYALYEDKKKINSGIKYIHNVGDFKHFSNPNLNISINEEWIKDNRLKVLYTGVLDNYKTDIELIIQIAELTKESHIYILVGPNRIRDKELERRLRNMENVSLLGYRNYELVPIYLYHADLLWLPYLKSSHTDRVFPLKIFEYLASGKPVISTNLRSIQEYKEYVNFFQSISHLKDMLHNVPISDTEHMKEVRIRIASHNTWESRLKKILDFIDE